MESESESRPLLHSFERETWRSSLRKRCLRIPSEVTITGIILGLFLIVVTLLIVLENLETTNKNELTLDNNLLASPFKYNKKALDPSWQEKKDNMKPKKKSEFQKWNKVDKVWKISDSSGISSKEDVTDFIENWVDQLDVTDLAVAVDKYGKELDDNWESLLEKAWGVANSMKGDNKDKTEAIHLLQSSKAKWKVLDDGWKTLSDQGWKDKEIKEALFNAIQEKMASRKEEDGSVQSSTNLDDLWGKIYDVWKQNKHKGDKVQGNQETLNDKRKNKVQVLQSPKTSDYKWKKVDNGWKKLSDQGWADKEIREALFKAVQDEKATLKEQAGILQSSMNLDHQKDKIDGSWKKKVNKGKEEQKKQDTLNDDWKNEMHVLLSTKAFSKKWKNIDDGWKKLLDQGWKNKEIREALFKAIKEKDSTLDEKAEILQSQTNFEDTWDKINDNWKKHLNKVDKEQEKQKTINDDWIKKITGLELSKSPERKWENVDDGWKNLLDQGTVKENSQESGNGDWANGKNLFKSPKASDKMKDDKGSQILSKQELEGKDIRQVDALKGKTGHLQSPSTFENFLDDVIQSIKDLQENESSFDKNEDTVRSLKTRDNILQSSMPLDKIDSQKNYNMHKTISEQGWKIQDIKKALYESWKDGRETGSMKWKKVNEGWKKTSNKS